MDKKVVVMTETLHGMILYSKVTSDLTCIKIETTSLETRTRFVVEYNNERKPSNINISR